MNFTTGLMVSMAIVVLRIIVLLLMLTLIFIITKAVIKIRDLIESKLNEDKENEDQ